MAIWKTIILSLGCLCAFGSVSNARELAPAPEIRIIGFSPDGRYFAYEQYEDDGLSGEGIAAIDVIDRKTGRSAESFPLGLLGIQINGIYPSVHGNLRLFLKEDMSSTEKLAAVRKAIAAQSKRKLAALKIIEPGRRLAGTPITDRMSDGKQAKFALDSNVQDGGVPDRQPIYKVSAAFSPPRDLDCMSSGKSGDHVIEITISEEEPDIQVEQDIQVSSPTKARIAWPAGDSECAQSLRITDVLEAPSLTKGGQTFVVVIVLAVSWATHAESSRYFATFLPVPGSDDEGRTPP